MTRRVRGALLGGGALAVAGLVVLGGASPAATSRVTGAETSPSGITYSGEVTQGGWIRGKVPQGTRSLTLDGGAVKIAPDGAWFAAFDRDARSSETLVATLADGRTVSRTIPVSPRAWRIENINIPRKPGGPSAAFMKIRQPELDRINAARARVTDAQGWRQHFIWPVKGRISGRFGSQRVYQGEPGAYHSGLDMATGTSGTCLLYTSPSPRDRG